jgi:predicted ATPase
VSSSGGLLPPGASIGDYTIEGVLGRGGMAAVYRARHRGGGLAVALKLIAPDSRWGAGAQEHFVREAQLAAAVSHRAILPVYEAGEYEGQTFVAMRLEQRDLQSLLRDEGRLDAARAVALVSQVASALDAAHAHGLVHRDVKPSNVLVGEEDGEERAYVADFGVARATFADGDLLTGTMVGTVGYASPEQIRGEAADRRTDVYALGCLLYECLTGQAPYAGRDSLATLWAHLQAEPPKPSLVVAALPRGLDEVVQCALAKRYEARFRSAGELAEAARTALDGGPRGAQSEVRLETAADTNLPTPTTTFLGRGQELDEADVLLEETRLLSVTGPGGSGKTRFALELATRAREYRFSDYEDGVFSSFLASLRDPALVLPTIAQTLSVPEQPGKSALEALSAHIGNRRMLLLLDNVEHMFSARRELGQLVAGCPALTLLITSREPLRLAGELAYELPPLGHEESVALLCDRAGCEPSETVSELCTRLEGLPLAIELAAARMPVISPEELVSRLSERLDLLQAGRDADPRQQTLRATIEWSYDLLAPEAQALFGRLSAFAGGCTSEAAEVVCDADLESLESLVDKSLLRRTDDRFWMLETIREYAAEQLERSRERPEVERRHAEYFLALAEEAAPNLRWSGNPTQWVLRLEAENGNLRLALDRLAAAGEDEANLRLAAALSRFWVMTGYLAEGRRRLDYALESDVRPTPSRVRALNGVAVMLLGTDAAMARRTAEEALALSDHLADLWGGAYAGFMLGQAAALLHDFPAAQQALSESLRRFRALGDDHYTLLATDGLAGVFDELGDVASARPLHEENLRRARALGNRRVAALSLDQLATYARDEGRIDEALAMLRESLAILTEFDDRLGIGENLARFARVFAIAGRAETAAELLAGLEVLYEETGAGVLTWVAKLNEETLGWIRSRLSEQAIAEAFDRGRHLTVDEAVALALDA